ncbi:MAG: class I SAM-dependent methyltransferase [Hyphomonadaceae bacterium]
MTGRVDIQALQRFYAAPLGAAAARMIERRLKALWPHAGGLDVLGIGYATSFLERLRADARRTVALMPAAQGACRWPDAGNTLAALGDESRLPFADAVFDRVLVVHGLEEAESPRAFLREIWRVTAPEGRLVVVAANRLGLWSHTDATPFGHGRPYTKGQLGSLLADCLFQPCASARALYLAPARWMAGMATPAERVGELLFPAFGGLVLMEAVKRLYAEPNAGAKQEAAPAVQPAGALPAAPA